MPGITLSVSQLGNYVQRSFQSDPILRDLTVDGEISNLRVYGNGMLFFTLKDDQASVACVMYDEYTDSLAALPFDGMRVLAKGSISIYVKGGRYQFIVRALKTQGIGSLYERLQQLRLMLAADGLFDQARKKPIPQIPDTIGVVTSPTGSVIRDILQVALRRNPQARILLFPVRVQGLGADQEIAEAIKRLDQINSVSTIILARGGGSVEDLWTFNEECVVRAVAACHTPVVSAVGHETDVTLCDLAADLRVPTPSAAAECTVPIREELIETVANAQFTLHKAINARFGMGVTALNEAETGLAALNPYKRLSAETSRIVDWTNRLRTAMQQRLTQAIRELDGNTRELELISPFAVLQRGYVIAEKDGVPIRSYDEVSMGDLIQLRFNRGLATAEIIMVKGDGDDGGEKE